jgi:2-polyprenyl-3-methyl-5-hydroxy-6-metoxy-1,4-benzoquinol methylase
MKKSDKNKVYEAYNEIIDWFEAHRSKELVMEQFYLNKVQEYFPTGGSVLDVGCGTGDPIAKFFINAGYSHTGVDASEKMIERCSTRFPQGRWILQDMRTLKLEEQFDVVIAWHSFFHLPQEDQESALTLLSTYVKPKGLLLFTSGPEAGESWGENGGYDLYHGSLSSEEYHRILNRNDLHVLIHQVNDPFCGGATVWVAQKN